MTSPGNNSNNNDNSLHDQQQRLHQQTPLLLRAFGARKDVHKSTIPKQASFFFWFCV